MITVTNENFETEVLQADKKVLVDFWAEWCAPCRMLSPIVDEIAQENDSFLVGKVNVDALSQIAMRYKVASIPTLIVFENGEVKAKSVGVISKAEILKLVNEA